MKAVRKMENGDGKLYFFDNIPVPEPGKGQIRIKVMYAAVCGTDLHIRDDEFPVAAPVTIGHEYCGIVDKVGENVEGFKTGERVVSMTAAHYCGKCEYCKRGLYMLCPEKKGLGSAHDGAFAEYFVYPADRVFHLPDNVGTKEAALCEPLACATRAVLERSPIKDGDYIYISGPGTLGQFASQLCKTKNVHVTVAGTNVDADRLVMAKKLGADEVIDVTKTNPIEFAKQITGGHMYDVAFECSGSARGFDTCIDVLAKTGHLQQIALYGKAIPVDLDKALFKEITFSNSYASERTSWELLMRLLAEDRINIKPLCSNEYNLENWAAALSDAENKIGYKTLFHIGSAE